MSAAARVWRRAEGRLSAAAKEHETRQAVREYEGQLRQATQSLAEFKSRALRAEVRCVLLLLFASEPLALAPRWSCKSRRPTPSAPLHWRRSSRRRTC